MSQIEYRYFRKWCDRLLPAFACSPRCPNYSPDYRTSPVVQNDAVGYDLRGIAGPFFREDNPAGPSGGSFIMHSHL